MIRNQIGRRNLNDYERSRLALKMKPLISKVAKENQGARTDICQNSDKSSVDTKKELAKIADVSHDTISKYGPLRGPLLPFCQGVVMATVPGSIRSSA